MAGQQKETRLPHGWTFRPAGKRPCPHCEGTGEVETPAVAISPTGVIETLSGRWTAKLAAEYAETWAPKRCSPERRKALYGA